MGSSPMMRADRRRSSRRAPAAGEALSRVRLRTGLDLAVIDVSDTGVLLEGLARLLPGTHVNAHIVTREGRELVRSRVVRAFVSDVQPDAVTYRAALVFDRCLDTSPHGYSVPAATREVGANPGTHYPPPHAEERWLVG